jgi:glycosyltransferase involved in cell wall biosynthesis
MISVVIPTYNEEKNIEMTLKKMTRQTLPRKDYEIIVVDGDSTDNTRKIARKYANKVIIQKSKFVSGARNDGVKVAKHNIIATTDADVLVPKSWMERIVNNFNDEDVIAVCGIDKPRERNKKSLLAFYLLRNSIKALTMFDYYCLGGTNSAFRKDVFTEMGGYRPLPHSDDADLSLRMRRLGKIVYDEKLAVRVSTRRMEKNGYLKTIWVWVEGDIRLALGMKIKNSNYLKQNY